MVTIKERLISIDIAKGITILLVVLGHALQGVVDSNSLFLDSNYSSIYVLKEVIYGFHMPAFFIISGLFLDSWLSKKPKQAITQKLKRLVYPYFVWSFLTACFMQIGSNFTNNGLGIKNFLLSPIIPFSQYWFLYVLFFFFLISYLVFYFFEDKYKIILLFISCVVVLIDPLVPDVWILNSFCKYLIYFSIGSFLLPYFKKQHNNGFDTVLSFVAFIAVNFLYMTLLLRKFELATYYYFLITSISGSLLLFQLSFTISSSRVHFKGVKKVLSFLGKNSMQIYVMHLIPLAGLRIVCEKMLGINNLWVVVSTTFLLSIVLCLLVSELFEKWKIQKVFFGWY